MAPGASDLFSHGWVPPASHAPDLYGIEQQGAILVTLRTDEKLLPASLIRQEADKRAKQIEAEESRKVGRREARELYESIAAELLPKAFTRSIHQRAIIDLKDGFVFVEASSNAKAENLLSVLRETLGSLPTRLIGPNTIPTAAMTYWLKHGAPDGFALDADCELKFPGAGGSIARFNKQNLDADEVRQNLDAGKLVTKLGMTWQDRISFVLTADLHLKKLTMLDVLQEQIEDASAEDQAALFDTTLALTIGELRELAPAVIEALGGDQADANHANVTDAESDPLYNDAMMVVIKAKKAGISFLQRHLQVGYNRAARLLERMEVEGIISPMDNSGMRTVIATVGGEVKQ